MKEVVESLYKSLPYETFRQVYQRTIRSLFNEAEIISAYMDPKCVLNKNVALHDIVAYQDGKYLHFGTEVHSNTLYLEDVTDLEPLERLERLERLLESNILWFKYLEVKHSDENTKFFMEHSGFVYQRGTGGKTIDCLDQSDLVEFWFSFFKDSEILQSLKRPKIIVNYEYYSEEKFELLRWLIELGKKPNNNLHLNCIKTFTVGDVYLQNYLQDFEDAVEYFHLFLKFIKSGISVFAKVFLIVNEETTKEQLRVAELMLEKIGYENIQTLEIRSSSADQFELPLTFVSKMINLKVLRVNWPFKANFSTLGNLKNTKLELVSLIYPENSKEWLLHGIPQTASVIHYNMEWELYGYVE